MTMRPPGAPVPQPSDPVNGYSVVYAIGPVVFWLWGHSLTGDPYIEARSDDATCSSGQRSATTSIGRPAGRSRPRPSYRSYPIEHPRVSSLADSPRWPHGYPSSRTAPVAKPRPVLDGLVLARQRPLRQLSVTGAAFALTWDAA